MNLRILYLVALFEALNDPLGWPELARQLTAAFEGNGVPFVSQYMKEIALDTTMPASTIGSRPAVMCTDSPAYDKSSKAHALQDIVNELILAQKSSVHFAGMRSGLCHHMTSRSAERFTGPFNHTLSNEIVVIGNTADVSDC